MKLIAVATAALLALAPATALAELRDPRYCGPPARDSDGRIERSEAAKRAFALIHPCPSTGLRTPSCPGWAIDHVLPLASCGCDTVPNMQWLPNSIKRCAGTECKDRWERKVYTCAGMRP